MSDDEIPRFDAIMPDGTVVEFKTLAKFQRLTGAAIGMRITEPVVIGVDVAREPDMISFTFSRRGPDNTIEIIDSRQISAMTTRTEIGPIWADECRNVPDWLWEKLGERMRAHSDDRVREIIMGPISGDMRTFRQMLDQHRTVSPDALDYLRPLWGPDPFAQPLRPPSIAELHDRMGLARQTSTTTPTPRVPLTPGDLERLRKAEAKRARKAAKRRELQQRAAPSDEPVCERCEGNGFVEVYSPLPPAFEDCPVCFNPDGHRHP